MYSPNSKYFQLPEIAIIRPDKKALPYTIIPIGGQEDLKRWKMEQALIAEAREIRLKPVREARRAKAIDMVANQNANTTLSKAELDEVAYKKLRAEGPKISVAPPVKLNINTQNPSVGAKAKQLFKDFWKAAFPE